MQTPSRLEGVSLQRNYQRFSIRRNCGCVGGGVRLPCVSSPSWRHFPRAWDPLVYFAGTWWGVFDSANLKTNKDAFGGLFAFSFSPLCSRHQTPSASQPPHIWYGAVGNGLSGARYVSVTLLFQCKKCTVLQAAAGIGAVWEFCDVHGEDCSFRTGLPLLGLHDCLCASLPQSRVLAAL